jgi:hypothetical protein
MSMAGKTSDIDLFIVVEKGRIWTARFWCTLICALFGLRAKKGKTKEKICLSFFVDEQYTEFRTIKKPRDIYFAFWLATMEPLVGEEYCKKIWNKNKQWVQQEAGIIQPIHIRFLSANNRLSMLQKIWEFFLPAFFEPFFKRLLLHKSKKFRNPKSSDYNPDMIFSDRIQKLHNPDLRNAIQEKWDAIMKSLN